MRAQPQANHAFKFRCIIAILAQATFVWCGVSTISLEFQVNFLLSPS